MDVLTTCCASFNDDWSHNTYRPGARSEGLLTVRRFRVGSRDRRAFDRVNAILLGLRREELRKSVDPLLESDARAFYENGINSPALYAYLASEGQRYDRILFLPYLYGPTLLGLPLVRERAFLQPCLHDEAYAYLGKVAEAVHAAKGLLLNSAGEYELALRLFGPGIITKSTIVGEGVETQAPGDCTARVGSFAPANERFVLYLGRQDPAKGVPTLVRAFSDFKRRHPTSATKLVLAGERPVSYGDKTKHIVDLGPVSDGEKAGLLAHCRILVQPSTNESFSRVIYEAWLHGRPVAVHRECLATATAVEQSDGGFLADSAASWEALFSKLEGLSDSELAACGERGRAHAREVAAWPSVIERYISVFEAGTSRSDATVRQLVPDSPLPKAFALEVAQALDRAGALVLSADDAGTDALVTVRHVAEMESIAIGSGDILIYHGFGRLRPSAESAIAEEPLPAFASTSRALEAARAGGRGAVALLPYPIDPTLWDAPPDPSLVAALQDGKHNLVYDGPITALAHLNDLLVTFLHYLTIERQARLTICASLACDDDVYRRLRDEIERLELTDVVIVSRELDESRRQAIYRCADAFVSLDAADTVSIGHLRALWFDVPILALKTPTATALLQGAALIIGDKEDLLAVATLAHMLVTEPELRRSCVRAQRSARERIGSHRVAAKLLAAASERRRVPADAAEAVPQCRS